MTFKNHLRMMKCGGQMMNRVTMTSGIIFMLSKLVFVQIFLLSDYSFAYNFLYHFLPVVLNVMVTFDLI